MTSRPEIIARLIAVVIYTDMTGFGAGAGALITLRKRKNP
jgi:hypothetical protein